MEDGAAVSPNAPVIGGRPALVRVFVSLQGGFQARDIVARLRVDSPTTTPIELEETVPLPDDRAVLEVDRLDVALDPGLQPDVADRVGRAGLGDLECRALVLRAIKENSVLGSRCELRVDVSVSRN